MAGSRADVEENAEVVGSPLPPELSRYTGYLVRRVFAAFSAPAGGSGTGTRDFAVLTALAGGDAHSQQELAERLGINRTIMVKVVDRLEGAGLVRRTRKSSNRRAYVLSLTEAGRAALDGMCRSVEDRDVRLTAGLVPSERDRLRRLLEALLPEEQRGTGAGVEYLITQVHYALRHRGDGRLAAAELRARHLGPLLAVDLFGPCPQQRLARYLAITDPAAAQLVDELVRAGLVTRGQDRTDRRRYALELTGTGREKLAVIRAAVDALQAEVAERLGPDGDEELRGLLHRLLAAPDGVGAAEVTPA